MLIIGYCVPQRAKLVNSFESKNEIEENQICKALHIDISGYFFSSDMLIQRKMVIPLPLHLNLKNHTFMTRVYGRFAAPVVLFTVLLVIAVVRAGGGDQFHKPDPGFRNWISAYSSGVLSTGSAIRIRLSEPFADSLMVGQPGDGALFAFSPSVSGEVIWVDSRTVEFRPDGRFRAGTSYTCTFHLGRLKGVPDAFREFVFSFHTVRQSYEVRLDPPVIPEGATGIYRVTGTLNTADIAEAEEVHRMITAMYVRGRSKEQVPVRWVESAGATSFRFVIDSLERTALSAELVVSHQGSPIGVRHRGEERMSLPGTEAFEVLDVSVDHNPDARVVITFSDILNPVMDYDGLVRLGRLRNLGFTADGNRLYVYPGQRRTGEHTLVVESSIRSLSGKQLGNTISRTVNFEELKPAVRMVGEGSVLPSSNGLMFPFEAVHLKAVDVRIEKIYERNVPQFLQVNELSGSGQMSRVAITVYEEKIDLTQLSNVAADFGQWNRYALDLSELIAPERGAIYRVVLSFQREYSTWPCGDVELADDPLTLLDPVVTQAVDQTWSFTSDHEREWYRYGDFRWSERNNPCSNSYYYWKSVSRNILSSDLGLIAKAGSDGNLLCFVTDIITAKPLEGIELEVMDMQMQVMDIAQSDREGRAEFSLDRRPFLVIARRGEERGYLKLGDANTLSVSLFDVDGRNVRQGIKGYLYAERGVWRPGDSMFVNFILEDKRGVLPDDIPVMFELLDPQGNVVQRKVSSDPVGGIYPFHVATLESSPTGNYLGRAYLGNQTFSRYFKVETVKPNRLRISLQFPDDRIDATTGTAGTLEARWLHGAKAPGLRADVTMMLASGRTTFAGYSGYVFDDPTVELQTEATVVFNGNLDDEGFATVQPSIGTLKAPGVLSALFTTRVFEPGGDFSINTVTVPYYPYRSYAGLWVPGGEGWFDVLETGRQHQFRVAGVRANGRPVTNRRYRVEIYRIDWRWWWHNSARGLPHFLSNTEAIPVFTTETLISNGRGSFDWGVGDAEWGRYLIRVTDPSSNHSTGQVVYMDRAGWGRRPGQMRDGASMLSISTDKERYRVGDVAMVVIPSAPEGRALVSIESGTSVLHTEWVKTDSGTTRIPLKITPEMAPNVYVHITLIQPHHQTHNDMPIRLYGVVPVMVEDPQTRLAPVLLMDEAWEAESRVTVRVRESSGRPMAYTLAVVDEGLLDLTGFQTPNPWNHFYGKEALGVRTWDLFSEVIGAFASGFDRMISIGGGDTRIDHDKQRQQRFPPVVKFLEPLYLEAGQTAVHSLQLPQYIGSVRVMVVAAHQGAYGHTEKTAAVRSPLMVLGTLPRVASPGETIQVPVNVFAMDDRVRNVRVSVRPGGLFEAAGETTQNVTFQRPGDQMAHFTLKVKEQTGMASLDIVAVSGNRRARQTIHLEVRNPVPMQVRRYEVAIPPGETWSEEIALHGIPGTNSAQVEFSGVPPLNLNHRLDFLIRYPHDCLEQILSAAFPQLLMRDLIALDRRSAAEADHNIRQAISMLHRYLSADGAFTYWPGGHFTNEWVNSYAGHFMLEAEKRGFALPPGFKQRWLNKQRRLANAWSPETLMPRADLVQAYRLYTLALAGVPDIGAMNRLRGYQGLSLQARWRLAAAYAAAGRDNAARRLVAAANTNVPPYREHRFTFGDHWRDKAMVLETAVMINRESLAASLAKELANELNSDRWLSTHTTAYALIAMGRFYDQYDVAKGIQASYTWDGTSHQVETETPFASEEITGISHLTGNRKIQVANHGEGTLYVTVRVTGIPKPGEEQASARGLRMAISYQLADGSRIRPDQIKQGTDFVAQVTITNTTRNPVNELALIHMVPSGWQIHNPRLGSATTAADDPALKTGFNYQDIRDDRVLTYFNLNPDESVTVYVMLNATYAGKFYLPAIHCEAMYDADVYAQSTGRWIEVVK